MSSERGPALGAPDVEAEAEALVERAVELVVEDAEGEAVLAAGGALDQGDEVEELVFGEFLGGYVEEMAEPAGVKFLPVLAGNFNFSGTRGQLRGHT